MISAPWTQRRLMVPRWRSLAITLHANELAVPPSVRAPYIPRPISSDLREKIEKWRIDRGLITAGELVGAALVEAQESEAVSAARMLISAESTATLPLRHLAALALKRAGYEDDIPKGLETHPRVKKDIWRRRTRLHPMNPLAWVELSLYDVNEKKRERARRSMLVALQQAPDNRHVLRSASRLFLHLGDPERAHDIVAKSDAIAADPWLIAAELSMSELADRKPRFFSRGRRILADGGLVPRQTTELASAIGTLELDAGRRKKARDYFRHSVLDPTGSALAQAEWASEKIGFDLVSADRFEAVLEADEAMVFHLIREDKHSDVPNACMQWSKAEPYSIRPYEIGSSSAAEIGDTKRALAIAHDGLLIRPNAGLLLNNYAFALASLGRIDEAENSLRHIRRDDETNWFMSEANRGLLALRRGEYASGLTHYKGAIAGFVRQQNTTCANAARLYFAREAATARIPEARELVKEAREIKNPRKRHLFSRLLREAEEALRLSVGP